MLKAIIIIEKQKNPLPYKKEEDFLALCFQPLAFSIHQLSYAYFAGATGTAGATTGASFF